MFFKGIKMKIVKTALMLACASIITTAQAQTPESTSKPRAVLFKLHDIKPVMNTEGMVTHCDFMATFYNRTEDGLRPAKLELGWTDSVTEKYQIGEEVTEEPQNKKINNYRNTAKQVKLGDVTTVVDMPALGSYKQVSVKATVETEKCFLLLDNLNFRVESCDLVGKETKEKTTNSRRLNSKRTASTECSNLFEYIDSKNPEYYDEFKNISYSEQERLTLDDRQQDVEGIEKTYNTVVENFKKAEEIINKIQ